MVTRYAHWLVRHRWLVILATLLWVGVAASGMRFLVFSNDYRDFFSEDNPQLHDFEALQDTYDKSDNILMVLSPKDGVVFSKNTLATV